ncbi:MAG: hypothetical protein NVSMB68_14870 [Thermoanaerobaculia bacterium]
MTLEVIPSLDLLDGEVVRLRRGAFDDVTRYGEPGAVLDRLSIPAGARLHIVDLEGSRSGRPAEIETVRRLRGHGYRTQIGGGIRSSADAEAWIGAGAEKVVIGTLAAEAPDDFSRIVEAIGGHRVIAATQSALEVDQPGAAACVIAGHIEGAEGLGEFEDRAGGD